MRSRSRIGTVLCVSVFAAGCASTHVSDRHEYTGGKVPYPGHIWIYDFVATGGDVPVDSSLAGQYVPHATPQTSEQVDAGRRAGQVLAMELVRLIQEMGLPALQGTSVTKFAVHDIVIRGYILSADPGDATKRVAIGFGSGESILMVRSSA